MDHEIAISDPGGMKVITDLQIIYSLLQQIRSAGGNIPSRGGVPGVPGFPGSRIGGPPPGSQLARLRRAPGVLSTAATQRALDNLNNIGNTVNGRKVRMTLTTAKFIEKEGFKNLNYFPPIRGPLRLGRTPGGTYYPSRIGIGGVKRAARGFGRISQAFLRGGVWGGVGTAAKWGGRIAGRAAWPLAIAMMAWDIGKPLYGWVRDKLKEDPFADPDQPDVAALHAAVKATGGRDPIYTHSRKLAAQRSALMIAEATGVEQKNANIAFAHALARSKYVGDNWDKIRQMAKAAAKSDTPEEAVAAELAKIRGWTNFKVPLPGGSEYKRPPKGGT